jgi:hypothetical protein
MELCKMKAFSSTNTVEETLENSRCLFHGEGFCTDKKEAAEFFRLYINKCYSLDKKKRRDGENTEERRDKSQLGSSAFSPSLR